MIIKFGKHSEETFTTITDVKNVSPYYNQGEFAGFIVTMFNDEQVSVANPPKHARLLRGKDFDSDCFEVLESEDVPCMWLLKEKISRLGISATDYSSAEEFAEAVEAKLAETEKEDNFKPIFS